MKKKSILLLCLGGLLSLMSCGHTATQVDQDLPRDDPTSTKRIVFWTCLGHQKTENLQKVADQFNLKYAGKYSVELVHLAGDYDSLHDALKTKLASGEIPALAMGYPDSFSEYITNDIEYSQILRLDNFIKDSEFGYSKDELDDFVPGYFNEGTGYQFKGTWSMPMYKSTEVMYYNVNYFEGCNAPNYEKFKDDATFKTLYGRVDKTNSAKDEDFFDNLQALKEWVVAHNGYTYTVPTTWDEMIALGKQMKKDRDNQGVTKEFFPIGYDSDANMLISQMKQRNIPYTLNNDETSADKSKHFAFVNADAKKLVSDILGYIKDDQIMRTKGALGGSTYTNTLFTEDKCAMTIGSSGGSTYNISSNFEVGLAAVPYANNNPQYIQQGPSICFFDNLDPYIHKGAWLFYKTVAETENNTLLALENSYDPVRKSCYQTDNYKKWVANKGKGLAYDIPNITQTLTDHYMTSPVFVGSGTARNQVGQLIAYTYLQKMSIDDAFTFAFNKCKQAA